MHVIMSYYKRLSFAFLFSSLLAREHYSNENMPTTAPQRIFPSASASAPHLRERIYSYVQAIFRVLACVAGFKRGRGNLGAREHVGCSLLPRAWSGALIPFPFPFERLPRRRLEYLSGLKRDGFGRNGLRL